MTKIQLPWAVKVFNPQSSSTNRLVWRYFETKAEAEKISKRVAYRPGHAWRSEPADDHYDIYAEERAERKFGC